MTDLQKEVERLREALRKAVYWAECASMRIDAEKRRDINWTYLNEARAVLAETPRPTQARQESCNFERYRKALEEIVSYNGADAGIAAEALKEPAEPEAKVGGT